MNYKIGLLGASGRMGLEIAALSGTGYWIGQDFLELTVAVSKTGKLRSVEGVPVHTLEDFPNDLVHVWIDFSRPEGTVELLGKIRCPLMIGSTGFSAEQRKKIEAYAENHPVLVAANTSPGMNQMLRLLEALRLPASVPFDTVLWEEHHTHKKDAPSGTAKEILRVLAAQGREVQVLVSRAGGTKGIHEVRLVSQDEELVISHRVQDRSVFAKGALLAAHFLCRTTKPGLYSMSDVFSAEGEVS